MPTRPPQDTDADKKPKPLSRSKSFAETKKAVQNAPTKEEIQAANEGLST